MAWKGIVGKSFSPSEFYSYVLGLKITQWKPEFIALHNTASPSLANRPNGITAQQIRNLEAYYRDDQKWSAGPHLFIDDKQIWAFTPLTVSGTHSPSWNRVAIGIEMLGDYSTESFTSGRGALVRANAVYAMAALCLKFQWSAANWKFHIEDPKTDHDCPGKKARVEKSNLITEIGVAMKNLSGGDDAWKQMKKDA